VQTFTLRESLYHGIYTEFFSQQSVTFSGETTLTLPAWDYRVYVK
jgi:hypothetical protein